MGCMGDPQVDPTNDRQGLFTENNINFWIGTFKYIDPYVCSSVHTPKGFQSDRLLMHKFLLKRRNRRFLELLFLNYPNHELRLHRCFPQSQHEWYQEQLL